jgi:hypothetical protein
MADRISSAGGHYFFNDFLLPEAGKVNEVVGRHRDTMEPSRVGRRQPSSRASSSAASQRSGLVQP